MDVLMNDFVEGLIEGCAKVIDKAVERLLYPYGITRDNVYEFRDRVEVVIDRGSECTRRAYFLDGEYIGTIRSHIDTGFEDLHAEFVAEIIYEDKERRKENDIQNRT